MNHWNSAHALSYDQQWGELAFHREIPKLAKVSANHNVLEIGCGGGYLSTCLANHAKGVSVLALDPTEKMIELAQQRRINKGLSESQLRFLQIGAEDLAVADLSLDIAIAAFSLHHWSDAERAMGLIFAGLKFGGRIWLCEDLNTPIEGDLEVNTALKAYEGIEQLLHSSGFSDVKKHYSSTHEGEFLIVEATKSR